MAGVVNLSILLAVLLVDSASGFTLALMPDRNVTRKTGDRYTVTCSIPGVIGVDPGLQWVKSTESGDIPISVTSDRIKASRHINYTSLRMDDIQLSDTGVYKCKTSNGEDSVLFSITVQQGISFRDTPNEQHPLVGEYATITCDVIGDPKPEITWFKDGKAVNFNGGRFTLIEDKHFGIDSYSKDDDGIYICSARQTAEGFFEDFTINVTGYVKPTIINVELKESKLYEKGVFEGADAQLVCVADGKPVPQYTWKKDGVEIVEGEHYGMPAAGILDIHIMSKEDVGDYTCHAKNAVGEISTNKTLDVLLKPTVENTVVTPFTVGKTVSVECRFEGREINNVTWSHFGKYVETRTASTPAQNENEAYSVTPGEASGDSSDEHAMYVEVSDKIATLHIKNVQLSDGGEYRCYVSNNAGDASMNVNLEIQQAPAIKGRTPDKIRAVFNKEYTMFCEAQAVPEPTWTWSKSNTEITYEGNRFDMQTPVTGPRSVLKIVPTQDEDFGSYTCTATNSLNYSKASIEVLKIDAPEEPDAVCGTDSDRTPTSIALVISKYSVKESEHRWPLTVNVTFADADSANVVEILLSFDENGKYKIVNLDPEKQYIFSVAGINEAGQSPPQIINCDTAAPTVPGKPVFNKPDGLKCDHADCTLSWNLTESGGKPVSKYLITYCVKDTPDCKTVESPTPSYVFRGLQAKTEYDVSVTAVNLMGEGEAERITLTAPDETESHSDTALHTAQGPGAGAIVGIVIIIVLIIVVLVDVACYYVNQCGLLMCICVNLCGKTAPEVKAKEVMMEEGGKASTFEERQEKAPLKDETPVIIEKQEIDVSESTPMIDNIKAQEKSKDTTV